MRVVQAGVVVAFMLVHVFAGRLSFLDSIPRSRWLSLAGGISVAYVFIHIFPELVEAQEQITRASGLIPFVEHHAYLIALGGLVSFYGLEQLVSSAQRRPKRKGGETTTGLGVFWVHVASFALYNALIGYLLVHRENHSLRGLLLFSFAMILHFLTNDYALRKDHKNTYRRVGRWVLMASVLAGWLVGLVTQVSEAAVGVLFAFLAGGVILNVLKEELPEERQSRFVPFVLGAVGYGAILLLESP